MDFFDDEDCLTSFGNKEFAGKFLTHVGPEDLDEEGRFVCEEPVILIGSRAFEDVCDKLTYVKINGVISIEDEAFANCEKLEKADIGFELDYRYLKEYDAHMFWKDKTINSDEDYYYFFDRYIEKFGRYDVHIKDGAFRNCMKLKSFHFPSRVILHGSPFYNCSGLNELNFDGSVHLQFNLKDLKCQEDAYAPLRKVAFMYCRNIHKISFGSGTIVNIDDLAQFENLQEVNISGSFFERRKFWHDALAKYPEFLLLLPSSMFQDQSFVMRCLYPLQKTLQEMYGYPDCKRIYKNLITRKIKIEKEKSRLKQRNLRKQKGEKEDTFSKSLK